MFAQYSPLFTSGLLSDCSPSSSRSCSPKRRFRAKKTAHDSLPVTVNSASFSVYAPHSQPESVDSAFYLTFKPSRRRQDEGHSFLSLDLAETHHRSMSLRRKDTVNSRATSFFGRSEPVSPVSPSAARPSKTVFAHSHVPSTSSTATVVPRKSTPVLRRTSRETLRLPSPKPAPSISLPEVPTATRPAAKQAHKRRPSDLTLTFSACFPDVDVSSPSTSYHHRPTYSAPPVLSPVLNTPFSADEAGLSYFAFSPTTSAPPTPPPTCTRPDSFVMPAPMSAPAVTTSTSLRASPSTRSTVSVATRQRNRSAALAALEGRNGRRRRASSVKRNFMSMSDDEDEEHDEAEDEERGAPQLGVLDEEGGAPPVSVSPSPSPSRMQSRRASKRASVGSETKRSRRSTIESFFAPLANFIDLRDDDSRSTRSWRSLVSMDISS